MNTSSQFTKHDTAAMKGIAILMMMVHHCFVDNRYADYDLSFVLVDEYYVSILASFCKICVSLFVFLSGYGITVGLSRLDLSDKNALRKQITRRYFSMMSGYWVIFILCAVLFLIFMPSRFSIYNGYYPLDTPVYALIDFMGLAHLFGTPTLIATWWYMSLAVIIVVITPMFFLLYKRFGAIALLIVTFMFCGLFDTLNFDLIRWLFTLALGMICADRNLLAKIKDFKIVKNRYTDYIIKLVIYTAVLLFCIYARQNVFAKISYLRDGIIPLFVIIYCYTIVIPIPIINTVLQFLGKHSMNIFLFHTILRGYILKDFIYGLKYPLVIVAVLIGLSLAVSIVVELIKKYSGYNKLCSRIIAKIA